ncbi:hypothetical protein FH690_08355 [Streptococcus suis]|nr:hypothetical protein DF184_09500 [Streptococcus suis]MBS8100334.1 hypothetical protein [Streptococcus suis]TQE45061.1 hypothetical protein FH690_08355 [Streptococcus suis]
MIISNSGQESKVRPNRKRERERTRPVKKRVRLPAPAQLIRSDLECKTRTNLPINHCAEMLTRTLRSEVGLFAQPLRTLFCAPYTFKDIGLFTTWSN